MRAAVKQFIEENIGLIENDQWSDVAYKAELWLIDSRFSDYDMAELWKIIREALNINIIDFEDMEVVPSYYYYNTDIEEIILPERILHINEGAFIFCRNLKKVKLPNTLYSIQKYAFFNTDNLTEIEFDGTLDEFKRIRLGWNVFGIKPLEKNGKKLIAKDGVMQL